jgi:LysM repeat protein
MRSREGLVDAPSCARQSWHRAALISCGFVIGALTLSLAERDLVVARALATEAPAQVYPSPVIFVDTPAPGEPTFTPSPSPEPSLTPGPPSETPNCLYPLGWTAITVQPGDTLDSLAQAYNTSVDALHSGNCLPVDLLMPGMSLFVPPLPTATATLPPTETLAPSATATEHTCDQPPSGWLAYTVQWGDTLARLAQLTGANVNQLKKANCLKSDRINAGQRLWVPRLPPATAIPYRTHTRIPTLPPTATVPPPTSLPPTQPPPRRLPHSTIVPLT